MAEASTNDLVGLAPDIVSSYVANNSVPAGELAALIATVHSSLQSVSNPAPAKQPTPAVPIKKSVTPEAIISLLDGKPYRTLKRHITRHGLTPAQYREQFGLPHDYPMVAPAYTAKRSELAKTSGLGQMRRKVAAKSAATSEAVAGEAPAKKRNRKKAA